MTDYISNVKHTIDLTLVVNCSSEQNKSCPQRHRYGCSPQAVPVRGTVTDVAPLRGKVVHGAGPPAEHCIGPRCVQQPEEGKDEESSHASSFSLQSGVVCSGHGVPGVHIAVHTHGDTLLLGTKQKESREINHSWSTKSLTDLKL